MKSPPKSIKPALLLLPALLYFSLAYGCSGAAGIFSGSGGGATGNTPEDRASGENFSSGTEFNGNGPGLVNPSGAENNLGRSGNIGAGSPNDSGGGYTAMAGNIQGGPNYTGGVGLGNEGHVTVKAYIHALVIPPSGSSDPASCYHQAQNFVGSLPSVEVGFGSSAQGPWEHFEKYTVDSSCGIRGIFCDYWVYEGREVKKIETDFIRLQAFYTAKPGDLYYPYTNVAPDIPDPLNLGLNPPKPDLSGKYQSDVVTLDCKDLAQKREDEGINFDQVENLLLKIPEPTQMMMPPR